MPPRQAAVPIRENLIVLGNRSTNRTMSALYDLFYCLVDLKYPGPEGYVVRSVHNPFGDGRSVVIVGGSDAAGVDAGANAFADLLSKTSAANGDLSIGWTMVTKLGKGVKVPTNIREFRDLGSLERLRLGGLFRMVQHQQADGDVLHDGGRV